MKSVAKSHNLAPSSRYQVGLKLLQDKGWDEDVAMSAMRESGGNITQALEALQEEDRSVKKDQAFQDEIKHCKRTKRC